MNKLFIVTRDGLKYHQFIDSNNLDESKCHRIKRFSDLKVFNPSGYILLKPYPPGFEEIIQWLEVKEVKNKLKQFKF